MAQKAEAWKEYKEAALVDMMLKVRVRSNYFSDFVNTLLCVLIIK